MSNVIYDLREYVAYVTINRPDRMNAVDRETEAELEAVWAVIEQDEAVRVVVLTGAGDRAFCTGADMKGSAGLTGLEYWATCSPNGFGGLSMRKSLYKPVIARVDGYALGGGFEMLMGCDIIVASEKSKFGLSEPRVGRLPLDGGMALLPRMTTYRRAMGILLTGRRIPAEEALEFGLINEVVPEEKLDVAVDRWVQDILACAPLSVQAIKEFAINTRQLSPQEAQGLRLPTVMRAIQSKDSEEGVKAFQEKRVPVWSGK